MGTAAERTEWGKEQGLDQISYPTFPHSMPLHSMENRFRLFADFLSLSARFSLWPEVVFWPL